MNVDGTYPRIVIVGRPNVGKSTLFNRLYGRRRAITDSTAGVTRDVIEEECVLMGISVRLMDTGGVKAEFSGDFDKEVALRAVFSTDSADIILFVVEFGELSAEDYLIAEKIRPRADKVILVVNKVDTEQKEYLPSEFYSTGFGEPLAVSAEHGRNIDFLLERIIRRLGKAKTGALEEKSQIEQLAVALVGKPNTGKSTLFNRLSGGELSLVSELPGTTRDTVASILEYRGRYLRLIDTAGMRRKSRIVENVEYYSVNRAIMAMLSTDVTVLLIDVNEGLSEQDKKIANQAVNKGRAVVMAVNKWDDEVVDGARLKKLLRRIHFQFPVLSWAPIVPISALNGYGIERLLNTVVGVDKQQRRRVETSKLNKALGEWLNSKPIPTGTRRPYRMKYITQVSTSPARFVGFVNRKDGFPEAYRRFLVNQIKRHFGFDLVPVKLELREGKR